PVPERLGHADVVTPGDVPVRPQAHVISASHDGVAAEVTTVIRDDVPGLAHGELLYRRGRAVDPDVQVAERRDRRHDLGGVRVIDLCEHDDAVTADADLAPVVHRVLHDRALVSARVTRVIPGDRRVRVNDIVIGDGDRRATAVRRDGLDLMADRRPDAVTDGVV